MTTNVKRNTQGLKDALFDQIDALRNGKTNPQKASATARLAGEILKAAKLEIEYQRFVNLVPESGSVSKVAPLALGSN